MLAESVHSVADSGNQALLLLGRKQATAPATVRHPLGQGRATYFWAFIASLTTFLVGYAAAQRGGGREAITAATEAVRRLIEADDGTPG